MEALTAPLKADGGYLYFTIGDKMLLADPQLTVPRFFRDHYARALGAENRMDWKVACKNPGLVRQFERDNASVIAKWKSFLDK